MESDRSLARSTMITGDTPHVASPHPSQPPLDRWQLGFPSAAIDYWQHTGDGFTCAARAGESALLTDGEAAVAAAWRCGDGIASRQHDAWSLIEPVRTPAGSVIGVLHAVLPAKSETPPPAALTSLGFLAQALGAVHAQENAQHRIDELTEANAALASRVHSLRHELAAYSYAVSHDLRTPLRAIEGFGRALEEDHGDHLDAQALDYLQRVRRASLRLHGMLDDLLKLDRTARGEAQRLPIDLAVEANALIPSISASEGAHPVVFTAAPGLLANADPLQARILLEVLLENAWKFTRPHGHGTVTLTAEPSANGPTVFALRDDGVGFDPHYAGKLFSVFQKVHPREQFPGSGIGLAIARKIVSHHDGEIWIHAEPDKGATVFFTLAPGYSRPTAGEAAR